MGWPVVNLEGEDTSIVAYLRNIGDVFIEVKNKTSPGVERIIQEPRLTQMNRVLRDTDVCSNGAATDREKYTRSLLVKACTMSSWELFYISISDKSSLSAFSNL